uniref:DUF4371 domain-containing protein n=1 Tax=Knipowitschia caucasica TaxID=637954 RepID=A0AAV2MIT0_KNICA
MDDDGASETYPEIDSVSASVLKAAGVKMTMLPSLTKEDLRDLFPGPENFLRRRHIWQLVHGDVESSQETCTEESDEPFSSPTSVSSPASSVASSSASTVILEKSTPSTSQEDLLSESPQSQARHYKTLQDMYKTKNKPNKEDVSQLLELEFQSRRAFIDSDVMKEQDRPTKILQAYPCFKELSHIIDELHRILARGNPFFTMELKKRWLRFFNQAQFYGVFKKFIGPPLQDQEGEFVKECLVDSAALICPEKKGAFEQVPLSRRTVTRRVEDMAGKNLELQLQHEVARFDLFSLALDESCDVRDTAQLLVFVRGITGFKITKELAAVRPMKGTTTGADLFRERSANDGPDHVARDPNQTTGPHTTTANQQHNIRHIDHFDPRLDPPMSQATYHVTDRSRVPGDLSVYERQPPPGPAAMHRDVKYETHGYQTHTHGLSMDRGEQRPTARHGDGRDPLGPSDRDFDRIARHINRFDPRPGMPTNTRSYLRVVDFHADRIPHASQDDKIFLIRLTSNGEVNDFIERQPKAIKQDYNGLCKAILAEYSDYGASGTLTAAMAVKQAHNELAECYYHRLRQAYFGNRNYEGMEEDTNFRALVENHMELEGAPTAQKHKWETDRGPQRNNQRHADPKNGQPRDQKLPQYGERRAGQADGKDRAPQRSHQDRTATTINKSNLSREEQSLLRTLLCKAREKKTDSADVFAVSVSDDAEDAPYQMDDDLSEQEPDDDYSDPNAQNEDIRYDQREVMVIQVNSITDPQGDGPSTTNCEPPFHQFIGDLQQKDTAANISLIGDDLFGKLQSLASKSHRDLKTQPCDLEIRPYSQEDTTIRKLALMRLTVGPITLVHPVYISPVNAHPLLLGQDLLNRFKPLIDFQRLKIWVQVREPLPIPRPLGENHCYFIDAPPANGPQPAAAQTETGQRTPTTCANAAPTRMAPDLDSDENVKLPRLLGANQYRTDPQDHLEQTFAFTQKKLGDSAEGRKAYYDQKASRNELQVENQQLDLAFMHSAFTPLLYCTLEGA